MEILNVIVAALAAFAFGAVWYMSMSKAWIAAAEVPVDANGKPQGNGSVMPFVVGLVAMVIVAGMMRHVFAMSGLTTIIGGPIGDRIGRRRVILWSILDILPLTLLVPWLPLVPSVIAVSLAGLILASAFPAMVVYAQDLMPHSTGMVAGLLFGLAFGIAALGAAGLGVLADHWGIVSVYRICAFLPLLGLVSFLLPNPRDGSHLP